MTTNQNITVSTEIRQIDADMQQEINTDVRSLKEDELDSVNGGAFHLALGAGILALALLTGHTAANYKR